MANPTDFSDLTPAPNPTPKKKFYIYLENVPWTAGQTFQAALAAALPNAAQTKVLAQTLKFNISIDAFE